MTTGNNHHPTEDLLRTFGEGQLSTGMSVAIAAHLEYCEDCRAASSRINAELATEWLASKPLAAADPRREGNFGDSAASADADTLLEKITRQPQVVAAERSKPAAVVPAELHMHERSVKLPRILAKAAQKGVVWRKLAGGINTAKLNLDRDSQCDFMYMKPGSQAPSHTHHGVEVTLVLDGTFEDELGEYRPGDFVLRHGAQTHTPRSDEGCLCYSVLDSPLLFTSGWSRLLNPFQRYLFNRQLRQAG
jgi:putative transcriptional regulator